MFGFSNSDIAFAFNVLSPAVTMVVCVFLAIVVIYRNQHREINRVFFFWMVISALNAGVYALWVMLESDLFKWISLSIGLLDPVIAIHFILLFTFAKRWISHKKTQMMIYLPAMLVMIIVAGYLFRGLEPLGLLNLYSIAFYFLEFLAVGLLAVSFLKEKERTARMQIAFIGIGILLMTLGFFFSIVLIVVVGETAGQLLQAVIIPTASILLAITVLRFRLMDVEEVIKKGIVFSFLSFIIICMFILLGEGLEFLFEDVSILGLKVPGILTAVIIALLILPLQGRLEKLINRLYPKKETEHIRQIRLDTYRTALADALEDEHLTDREERLLRRVRESLDITDAEDEALRKELLNRK